MKIVGHTIQETQIQKMKIGELQRLTSTGTSARPDTAAAAAQHEVHVAEQQLEWQQ